MFFGQENLDSVARAEKILLNAISETKYLQDERLNTFVESIKVAKR